MFAQSILDFGVSEGILLFVRIIATVGGAFVGWFAADPLTRIVYRLSFKGATPGSLLLLTKIGAAATLAALIWFFMPLGGGGGGFGWGPGAGGSPGKGLGKGGSKGPGTDTSPNAGKDGKDSKGTVTPKTETPREPVKIEILGGPRFKNDGAERYYLVLGKNEPARSIDELTDFLKKNPPSVIEIVHSDDTAMDNTKDSPTRKLRKLAAILDVPTKGPKE